MFKHIFRISYAWPIVKVFCIEKENVVLFIIFRR